MRFLHPRQWQLLDFDAIYAMDWRHPGNPAAYYRHSSQKCAEVLVPQRVETRFLTGAYVVDDAATKRLKFLGLAPGESGEAITRLLGLQGSHHPRRQLCV